MMAIWHLMTNGAELMQSEITVDEAIENYLKIMHSTNVEVCQNLVLCISPFTAVQAIP